jgi:hypothetical protein
MSWEIIRSQSHVKYQADIPNLWASQVLEHWNEIEELVIVSIRKPAADRDCMLWVENV